MLKDPTRKGSVVKLLLSLAAALVGLFTTGCSSTSGQISTTIDGVDVTAATNGKGGASLTVGTDAGSVEISGQLGHAPAVIVGPPQIPVDTAGETVTVSTPGKVTPHP